MNLLDLQAMQDIAFGANFLGAGGGGDTYPTELQLMQVLQQGGKVQLLSVNEIDDDALVAPCGWVGAPGIEKEKYPNGNELSSGLEKLESVMGRTVSALLPKEIGGQNGLTPFLLAAKKGIPVLDCDGMGRAFPQVHMVTFNIYGCKASPVVIADGLGNSVVLETVSNRAIEQIVRPITVSMGGRCHMFDYPVSGKMVKQYAVHETISLARNIGASVREAREAKKDPIEGLLNCLAKTKHYNRVFSLFDGKIVDLERNFEGGFSKGKITIESFSENGAGKRSVEIFFQNENLVAYENGNVLAMVPDIISVVDRETAETINTENLKYGQRVKVVATSVPPVLRSVEALEVLGPQAFGINEAYSPVEELNS